MYNSESGAGLRLNPLNLDWLMLKQKTWGLASGLVNLVNLDWGLRQKKNK
jgi:hypothetical protein